MRKTLFAGVAAVALAMAGSAFADDYNDGNGLANGNLNGLGLANTANGIENDNNDGNGIANDNRHHYASWRDNSSSTDSSTALNIEDVGVAVEIQTLNQQALQVNLQGNGLLALNVGNQDMALGQNAVSNIRVANVALATGNNALQGGQVGIAVGIGSN